MKTMIQVIIRLVILLCLVAGIAIIVKNSQEKNYANVDNTEGLNPKAVVLKKFLKKFNKPERVEIFNYTKKFDQDVTDIKNMKVDLDKNSNFYLTIQFFTDETDAAAPLVAQIRFLDLKTNNLRKEESINLDDNKPAP
jgi:hypothetical protein